MAPPIRISSDSTAAKIGRWMKNWEKFIGSSYRRAQPRGSLQWRCPGRRHLRFAVADRLPQAREGGQGVGAGHLDLLRIHLHARADPLQAIHDDPVALAQAAADDAQALQLRSHLDGAVDGLVVAIQDQHELLAQVGADRFVLIRVAA